MFSTCRMTVTEILGDSDPLRRKHTKFYVTLVSKLTRILLRLNKSTIRRHPKCTGTVLVLWNALSTVYCSIEVRTHAFSKKSFGSVVTKGMIDGLSNNSCHSFNAKISRHTQEQQLLTWVCPEDTGVVSRNTERIIIGQPKGELWVRSMSFD